MDSMHFCTTPFISVFVAYLVFFPSLAGAIDCSSLPQTVRPVILPLSNCTTLAHDNVVPVASTWGLSITLASPPQELCVMPSVFTNNTFIPTVEVCSSDNTSTFAACTSRRGGLLDIATSGANFTAITASNDSPPDVNWAAIDPTNMYSRKGDISLRLPYDISIPVDPIKTIEGGQKHNVGHFGLSISAPILQLLSDMKGLVKGWALDAGSQSVSDPREGYLIIGGYDPQRVGAYTKNYTLTDTQTSGRVCSLYVTITELILSRPETDDVTLISMGEEIPACIDPYDMLFRFPSRTLESFVQETHFENNSNPDPSDFLVVEPGLAYPSSVGFNGSLKFTLDYDFVVEIPNEELVHPLRGINRNGTLAVMPNVTEVNIFYQDALLDTAVLGRAFLSKVYLSVEYRSTGPVFRLAQTTPGQYNPNPVPFDPDCTNSSGLDPGKIAAIVVPVTVVLGAILAAIFYYKRRRERQKQTQPDVIKLPESSGIWSRSSNPNLTPAMTPAGLPDQQ